jgi:hypothetical protein
LVVELAVVELVVVEPVDHRERVAVVDIDPLVATFVGTVDALPVVVDMDYHRQHRVEDCNWIFAVAEIAVAEIAAAVVVAGHTAMDHYIHQSLYPLLPTVRTAAYMAVAVIYQEMVVYPLEQPLLQPELVAAESSHPVVVCLDLARVVHFDKTPLQRPRKPERVD